MELPEVDRGPREGELERVLDWRFRQLLQAGYPLLLAEAVAASDADLHRAVELITSGCPAQVAARILL